MPPPSPPGMEAAAASENATPRGKANGGNMVVLTASERALLSCLLARLQSLDADVLAGHNVAAFDLTVLLSRMQHHKVGCVLAGCVLRGAVGRRSVHLLTARLASGQAKPSQAKPSQARLQVRRSRQPFPHLLPPPQVPLWSRIGRVKKTEFPRLTGGGHTFGGGAGAGVMSTVAGRLLCDTYLAARESVKSVDFTLATLSSSLLGQHRSDLAAAAGADPAAAAAAGGVGVAACYGSAAGVLRMLRHGETDAWLALGLMFHLSGG